MADREIELKLELEPDAADQLRRHPALDGADGRAVQQVSTYFDTSDGALRKAGFSLRVRQSGSRFIQTVKQGADGAAGLFDRPEWETDVPDLEPDLELAARTPLGDVLTKKVRKKLQPLVRSEMQRTTWLVDRDGQSLEVTLDEGRVCGGDSCQPLAEIEIELKQGEPAALVEFARKLGADLPVRLGVLTKAERGWGLADGSLLRAAKATRIALDPDMNSAEGFTAIAASCLRQFRLNEPIVIERRDPTALHQARVAMRRLRSAFTLFRPVIVDDVFAALREEVRWFTDQLGPARNLDVLLKRAGHRSADLREVLEGERERAYDQVIEALNSARLRRLTLDLVAWIETGPWRDSEQAQEPLEDFASAQLDKRWRKVKRPGRVLAKLDPEARHRLRIEIKKLRYAIEFLAALQRDQAAQRQKQFAAALEEMQEQLGELNDVETARGLLADLLNLRPNAQELIAAAQDEAPQSSEGEAVRAAARAFERLVEIGRFWR
jgi:inorganic triphosphatase YgiF